MSNSILVGFVPVCERARLVPNRGVAALVDGVAIAVFAMSDGSIHAIDNVDPISGASVLSRGLTGDVNGELAVASPMYKQRFSLLTGRCLDDPSVRVTVHEARINDDIVEVKVMRSP